MCAVSFVFSLFRNASVIISPRSSSKCKTAVCGQQRTAKIASRHMWSRLNHARYVRTKHNSLVDCGCTVEEAPYLLLDRDAVKDIPFEQAVFAVHGSARPAPLLTRPLNTPPMFTKATGFHKPLVPVLNSPVMFGQYINI